MYRIQHNIQLYWQCVHCEAYHPWPAQRARKYCNKSCQDAAYYQRNKKQLGRPTFNGIFLDTPEGKEAERLYWEEKHGK